MSEMLIVIEAAESGSLIEKDGDKEDRGRLRWVELRSCADYRRFGRGGSAKLMESELVDRVINADWQSLILRTIETKRVVRYAQTENRAGGVDFKIYRNPREAK